MNLAANWWKYLVVLVIAILGYYYLTPQFTQESIAPLELQNTTVEQTDEQTVPVEDETDMSTDKETTMEEYTTTASGLKYKVISQGEGGEKPVDTSQVEVHYHGTLVDGTVFDSSRVRGETISFGLRQGIPGWTEGLQLMSVGDVYEFYIPAELAYGDRSPSPLIPAGSDLIFEVELFNITN